MVRGVHYGLEFAQIISHHCHFRALTWCRLSFAAKQTMSCSDLQLPEMYVLVTLTAGDKQTALSPALAVLLQDVRRHQAGALSAMYMAPSLQSMLPCTLLHGAKCTCGLAHHLRRNRLSCWLGARHGCCSWGGHSGGRPLRSINALCMG